MEVGGERQPEQRTQNGKGKGRRLRKPYLAQELRWPPRRPMSASRCQRQVREDR
jgi:hypothetical protein